ncbi:MAG: fadD3 1 [Gammaproteobacteria bacterium]|nr:fadD3 1 [Gammaproteobacteria bacterium]
MVSPKWSCLLIDALSIAKGPPLSEEPGLGSLTLPGFLREVTTRFADREALVLRTPNGVERWSYATLWERSVEVARALLALGAGKDSRVGVMMTNRPEWISAVFGTGLAGGTAVLLSTFSTPPELEYLLQASGVTFLLFERTVLKKDFAAILGELEPQIHTAAPGRLASARFPFLRHLAAVGDATGSGPGQAGGAIESWSEFLARGETTPRALVDATAATVLPANTGVLFFSSGSTSRPKGILGSHRSVSIQCWRWPRVLALEGDVRCWTANGFFWSGNFTMAMGCTLAAGGTLVLQPTFAAAEALDLMQAERVTLAHAWPHQWAQLVESPNWSKVDLSSLCYVDANGPAARHPTVSTRWLEPRWAYGNTETFTINCIFPSNTPPEVTGETHGVPLPGNTLKIVDPQTGATVPRGERGEIAIKGPTLMLGYIDVPIDETLDEEGFFRTGDGGYMDDGGRLVWEGRLTDIIKTGGANVSPLEIDAVLANYPGLKIGRTVGVPHDTLGELVVSCVVPHDGATLEEAAIRDFLKERLASYKVPRRVLFFREDELSMTGSAKVKSGSLRELAAKHLKVET